MDSRLLKGFGLGRVLLLRPFLTVAVAVVSMGSS